jgi:hypothetical protein
VIDQRGLFLTTIPPWITNLWSIIKKLGSRLLKPKSTKENQLLKDHSFRQTNIFSKTNNQIFVVNTDSGQNFLANIDEIPDKVIELLDKQFNQPHELKKDEPTINIISSDFHEEMEDYSEFYYKQDKSILNQIYRYLDSDYRSILKLSVYVQKLYTKKKDREAQEVKNQIGMQYGKDGRKLCNLYLKGYIDSLVNYYIKEIFEKAMDKNVIGIKLNKRIRTLLSYSEDCIFFINPYTTKKTKVVEKITELMIINTPYIALHSAGSENIKRAETILDELNKNNVFEMYGYILKQESPESTSSCPFFDVYIRKKK